MAYQEALQNTELIVKDEAARRLRVRILLLENETEDLNEQLAMEEDRIDLLEQEGDGLRVQLEHSEEETRRQESDLRVQTRELHNLRVRSTACMKWHKLTDFRLSWPQ